MKSKSIKNVVRQTIKKSPKNLNPLYNKNTKRARTRNNEIAAALSFFDNNRMVI